VLSSATKRRLALGVLGTLLLVLLSGANVLVALDRTVLDADHVTDTFEEEGGHVAMAETLAESFEESGVNATGDGGTATNGSDGAGGGSAGGDGGADGDGGTTADGGAAGNGAVSASRTEPPVGEIAREAVTPEYVQGQLSENVHDVYAYLHGERDDLEVTVDTVPVKEAIQAGVEEWVLETDLAALDSGVAELAESEQQFRETRQAFEAEQLDRIQRETDREYSEAQLREIYDDRRTEIRDGLVEELEREVAASGAPEPLHEPTVQFGTVRIDALVGQDATYEGYVADVEAAREELAPASASAVRTRLDEELNDTEDLGAGMDRETRERMETARTGVSLASILVYALPLGALGVAGLIGWVSTTRSAAFRKVGTTTAVAGLTAVVGTVVARRVPPLSEAGSSGGEPALEDVAFALAGDVATAVGVQGGVLLGVGVLLVGVGAVVGRGMGPIEDVPGGATPGGAAREAATEAGATGPDGAADAETGTDPSAAADGAPPTREASTTEGATDDETADDATADETADEPTTDATTGESDEEET